MTKKIIQSFGKTTPPEAAGYKALPVFQDLLLVSSFEMLLVGEGVLIFAGRQRSNRNICHGKNAPFYSRSNFRENKMRPVISTGLVAKIIDL
jgi:hypothetical protein